MIEDDINSNQCRFCNSSFSVDILKKIKDDRNDVYCENCGDLIKRVQNKYNFNPTKIIEKTSNTNTNTNTNDTPTKPQKDLESNPDALHYPIGRIFYDTDFPLIFKSNFIIVFSRLIYFHAIHLERKGQIELGSLEIPENTINNIFMSIRHIQNKRIKSSFLNNLHEISKEEFERNLKQLQAKIQSNREYREDFIVYSRWLIKRVLMIVSEKKPNDQLTKFERTILTDIKKLNLDNFKVISKPKKTTYEKYVELGKTREDLEFDMTREEFKKLLQNRDSIRPSHLKYRWRCTRFGHTWDCTYHNIKVGTRCPQCPQRNSITYEDYLTLIEMREDIYIGMTRVEFYNAVVNRGNINPSEIKLKWKCSKKNHTWQASYRDIRNGYGCTRCPKGSKVITYKKCIELGNTRDELYLDMTKEEFNNAIEERGSLRPSSVKLRWKCVKFSHTWNTSYQQIYIGKGCPQCFSTSYEKCIVLAESRDDLNFDMTREEFSNAINERGSKTPNAVQLRWRCLINFSHNWPASYNHISKGSGCPFCGEKVKIIGEQIHYILEYLSIKYLKIKGCQAKHEVEVTPKRKYRIDLMIERNNKFIDNIERNQCIVEIPEYIKKVAIDFTFSLDSDKILKKCSKKYQNSERFLLIILIREQKDNNAKEFQQQIINSNNIRNKDNIKIINYKDFLRFMDLTPGMDKWRALTKTEKKILSKFIWVRDLAMSSIEFDFVFDELIEAGKHYRNLLK